MMSLTAHATTSTHAHKSYYFLQIFTAKCLWSNKKVSGIYIKKSTKLKIMINSQLIFTVSDNYSSHVTACLKIILRIFL